MPYPTSAQRPDLLKILEEEIAVIKSTIKPGEKVLCALSGGVDSCVVASILHEAIGDQLICVFVDHGGMRFGEAKEIKQRFTKQFGQSFIAVDASKEYLRAIKGVSDSEQLRKIIGKKFIDVFKETVDKFENIKYFAQGTILTDLDESGHGGKNKIKTHHNVDVDKFVEEKGWTLIEPLKRLRKEDVRTIGSWMNIPEEHLKRQPFPGPGNYLRVIGGSGITGKDLKKVSEFDAIVRRRLDAAKLPDAKQYFGAVAKNMKFRGDFVRGINKELIEEAKDIIGSVIHPRFFTDDLVSLAPKTKVTGIRDEARAEEPIMVVNGLSILNAALGDGKVSKDTDIKLNKIKCEIADRICAALPIGRVMYNQNMASLSNPYSFIVRAINTTNFDRAVPTYINMGLRVTIKRDLDELFGRCQSLLFDMTSKPSSTVEYR